MKFQAVQINLGSGDLNVGFPRVTVQLWVSGYSRPQQFVGSLPGSPTLGELYRYWQSMYSHLCQRYAHAIELRRQPVLEIIEEEDDELEIVDGGITNVSEVNFREVCQQIETNLNHWLDTPSFAGIEAQLRSQLSPNSEIQVTLETNDHLLRCLPWHCWGFLRDYPQAELGLSQAEYIRQSQKQRQGEQVRILAVLGDSQGIDLVEERRFLENLHDGQIRFLVNPTRQELREQLLNPQGWEILFFAGHSQTEGETGRIYLNDQPTDNSLTLTELQTSLKVAIANGLKLTIFNSCDGLGLANSLEKLHIPTIIVMRERIPNQVAQEFFKVFLRGFALNHLPLYLSVRQAREHLTALESEFPGASWLPIICQNPAVEPPTWLNITESVRLLLSSEQIYALQKILLNLIGPIAPALLQKVLAQVRNFEDLVGGILPHLSSCHQEEFQQQVRLLLTASTTSTGNTNNPSDQQDQVINPDFLQECQLILTEVLGPIGGIVMQQAMNQHNPNRTQLIDNLASKIPDSQLRCKFLQRIKVKN